MSNDYKVGRPSLPENKRKTRRYTIYLDESSGKYIESIAEMQGIPVSVLLRMFLERETDPLNLTLEMRQTIQKISRK
jgi:hypothetical protein